ncbi:dihydrofolate reductase [Leucobacter luti]|uniref:dihydrofolate reductase n=1 Tax=Leucobacter luti TaxID=340320 RepID=UPI003D07247E
MTLRIGMIWAQARDGAIGRGGEMPWHVPEDLAHFKRMTQGAPVVMGRRTWESLPERFRPLAGRANIVVTRDADYAAEGAEVVGSLDAALAAAERHAGDRAAPAPVWIMGGGELYRAAMPVADELVVTRLEVDVPGADTFAPEIGPEWRLVDAGDARVSQSGVGFRSERWER